MLARLQTEEGVHSIEVDRRGELLRARLSPPASETALIEMLYEMGIAATATTYEEAQSPRWYSAEEVGELSREEAEVIARRVVPPFAKVTGADVDNVVQTVARALHECLSAYARASEPGAATTLNNACGLAAERATRPLLGSDSARALGAAIEADLASRSAFKE